MPLREHLLSPAKPQKAAAKKNGRRKLAVSALIGLSSIMVSADALANAGNDTGDGVTPTGTQTGGKGWIAIGTDATANTYTNVDAQAPQWVIKPPRWGNGVPPLVPTASPPATLR